MVCDQGDFRAIDAIVSEVADTYGRIDILVNNAGGTVPDAATSKTFPNSCNGSRAHPAPTTISSGPRCFTRSPCR